MYYLIEQLLVRTMARYAMNGQVGKLFEKSLLSMLKTGAPRVPNNEPVHSRHY
mgnify:CR=1 FL=1